MADFVLGILAIFLVGSPLYPVLYDRHVYRTQRRKLAEVIAWTERSKR